MPPGVEMQKNTKALLTFFSIFGVMIVLLLVLLFINIESGNIRFFFNIHTDKPEKTIRIQQEQTMRFRL
jgi:uncharacterized integral membrane protein